ncbi:coiled-coil domain-containing protein 103 [Centruroides vittatus]|uniref:coiled-coil domain-containing protein 103 n=1 Tax=Centruroides vittatus TaxID=120091 RepID=UPI00350F9510
MDSFDRKKALRDISRLEKEALDRIEADRRYWEENAAKFRAVEQKVGTYEEFADIVKACHLKPLTRDDFKNKGLTNNKSSLIEITDENYEFGITCQPKTRQEFERSWKYFKNAKQRFILLKNSEKLFIDFISERIGELARVFIECFDIENIPFIIDVLEQICSVNRFKLCVQFLTIKEENDLKSLFSNLENSICDKELRTKLEKLKTIYLNECA